MPKAEASSAAIRADQFRIPTARDGQRDRKYGFIAVDHVETDQQRNAEPRLLDGDLLRFLRRGGVHAAGCAEISFADRFVLAYGGAYDARNAPGSEVQLPQFFVEGHFAHQVVDECVHFRVALSVCQRSAQQGKRQ